MRILMRNTVFKTTALAALFLCMLALVVVFFGTTDFAHATHDQAPAITADQVTEENLEEFVQGAADAYYIDLIMKHHCNFSSVAALDVPGIGMVPGSTIQNLLPNLPTATIKNYIPAFSDLDMTEYCDLDHRFPEVFDGEDGNWKSGSIYLFIMNDEGEMLYHGADPSVVGTTLDVEDAGERDVLEVITDGIDDPSNPGGIVQYCWDDPTVMNDDNRDENGDLIEGEAPGDSWKISYVVDPFEYLGMTPPMDSPGVIFGSGIYPKDESERMLLEGCRIVTDDEPEPMEPEPMEPEPMEPEPMEPEPMEPEPMDDGMPTSVSGGGCAIAAGSGSTPRNDALNLLIVSALFLAVSFGNRAAGRRNGSSS